MDEQPRDPTPLSSFMENIVPPESLPPEAVTVGAPFWVPTPGWVVRQPAQQDPNKRDGDVIESPWLGAFGIYASTDGGQGLHFHAVLVHLPDMKQGLLGYVGLDWMPAQFESAGA